MSQKDDIISALGLAGPMTMHQLAATTGIKIATLQAQLSELKKRGRATCDGIGSRDPWRLPKGASVARADDPTMMPGGPLPACEIAAIAEDEGDDERPTADVVAMAVVAAAKITGEDPLSIARDGWLRLRFPAAKALNVFYPDIGYVRLGRYLGLLKLTEATVRNFEGAKWWPEFGDPAFEAAVSALEAA